MTRSIVTDLYNPPEAQAAGIESQQVSNNQEAQPLPYLAGTRLIAGTPITPIISQRAVEAKDDFKKK